MQSGFISSFHPATHSVTFNSSFARNSICERRRTLSTKFDLQQQKSRSTPCMMAKFQQQEENNQQLDQETDLEKIIPPPALPTLTTLTGPITDAPDIDLSVLSGDKSSTWEREKGEEVEMMGPGLSAEQEGGILSFLMGVYEEFKHVEWPTPAVVIRFTLIILASLSFAIVALYLVDGFFYRMAQIVFEGKV